MSNTKYKSPQQREGVMTPSKKALKEHQPRTAPAALSFGATHVQRLAIGAQAVGALAIGALAVGSLAIGALAINRLVISRSKIRRLEIDELIVGKLRVME